MHEAKGASSSTELNQEPGLIPSSMLVQAFLLPRVLKQA